MHSSGYRVGNNIISLYSSPELLPITFEAFCTELMNRKMMDPSEFSVIKMRMNNISYQKLVDYKNIVCRDIYDWIIGFEANYNLLSFGPLLPQIFSIKGSRSLVQCTEDAIKEAIEQLCDTIIIPLVFTKDANPINLWNYQLKEITDVSDITDLCQIYVEKGDGDVV